MRDIDKTKEQLIGELAQMRQRVAELEASEADRKQVEETLKESTEKWNCLVENAPGFIMNVDRKGKIQFINRGVPGISVEEATGQSIYNFIAPEYHDTARKTIERVIRTGKPSSYEVKGIGPNSHALSWYATVVGPIKHDGQVTTVTLIVTDITERKQVEKALRESEEKHRQLVENLHEGVWVIDKEAYTSFVNPRMAEMLGYTVDEMLGKHFFSFMDQYGVKIATRNLARYKLGIREQRDSEFLRKDGTPVHMLLATSPIIDEEGNYAGAISGVQDITERRQMEETLQESEKRYRELANFLPQIVFETDEQANLTFVNRRAFEALGYTLEDFADGLNALQMLIPEDRDRGRENIQRVWNGEDISGTEYTALRKDGSTFPVLIYSAPITRGDKSAGLRGLIIDITERKQAEEALRQSEEKYRELTNTSIDGVVSIDSEMKAVIWNQGAEGIFQYTQKEMLGQTIIKIVPERYRQAMREGFAVFGETGLGPVIGKVLEVTGLRKDGTEVPVELSVSSRKAGETYIVTAIIRDITKRKKVEELLRKARNRTLSD